MNMTKISEALEDFNPWWKGKFSLQYKDREVYGEMQKFMKMPQIMALTGLRRVGKTTLMLKIAEDFLNNGADPRSILYFSFDEFDDIEIRVMLREYEELAEKKLEEGRYLVLLDEVQKLKNWENQLKTVYDVFGKNAKIFISGSESLFIKKKSKETLAGRIFEFKVEQLSFKEFLSFKGIESKPVGLHRRELLAMLAEFSLTMGLPELVGIKDKEIIKKYVREGLIEKIIYRDIPKMFRIKDVSVLQTLLNIFIEEPGQLVDVSGLAKDMKISRQTLANYLNYLEQAFLLRKLYNFSRNRKKTERKLKKFYPALVSVDLLFREDDVSKSKVFEWLLINQLKGEFFWRDQYKNEVDLVLADKNPVPVEIKYGKIDVAGMLAFMRKFKTSHGYILSKNIEENRKIGDRTVSIVPAFKFLLR